MRKLSSGPVATQLVGGFQLIDDGLRSPDQFIGVGVSYVLPALGLDQIDERTEHACCGVIIVFLQVAENQSRSVQLCQQGVLDAVRQAERPNPIGEIFDLPNRIRRG